MQKMGKLALTTIGILLAGFILSPVQPSQAINADYTIKIQNNQIIAVNSAGTTVLTTDLNNTSGIIQKVHDRLKLEKGSGTISIESGTYPTNPVIFTIPIKLTLQSDTLIILKSQAKGNLAILKTLAPVEIAGGIFDCDKAKQPQPYIHGLIIDIGSKNSQVKYSEFRNCGSMQERGNGIVVIADNSIISNIHSHDNDGDGIYVKNCDHCIVQHSKFNNNEGAGIDLSQQDGQVHGWNTVYNNTVTNSGQNAISIDSISHNIIDSNKADGGYRGVALWHSIADCMDNEIKNNTIIHSTVKGIKEQGPITENSFICDFSYIHNNTIIISYKPNAIMTGGANTVVGNNTMTKG